MLSCLTVKAWGSSMYMTCRICLPQEVAQQRALRFTFLSGDVHLGAFGRLTTAGMPKPLREDHRFMAQVRGVAAGDLPDRLQYCWYGWGACPG